MSTEAPTAPADREVLRKAIADRENAREAARLASEAAQRGRKLLHTAEAKLRAFGDVDAAILQHRRDSYRSAALSGATPSLALPDDLLRRERGCDEARSAVAAAKAASECLTADVARAEGGLRRAERVVSEHARAMLVAEAATIGASLLDAWSELWVRIDSLNALVTAYPVQLPSPVMRSLQVLATYDFRQFPGGRNEQLAEAR